MRTRQDDARPFALDADLADPDTFVAGVPHEAFKLLRREAPVYWHPDPEGPGFWAVTKHADVMALTHDWAIFSSGRKGVFLFDPPPEDMAVMKLMMVNMDPPDHTKLRSIVKKGFTPRMLARLEPHIRDLARRIVDRVAQRGECDFVAAVAAELPLQVIAEMMGIPHEDRHLVFDWSNRLIGYDDPEFQTSYDDGKVAAGEMYVYSNELAARRRKNPGDDLVSVLMDAEVDGEKMTELQFDLFFLLLAVAGNETTRNAISGGMLALIEHPEQRARLLADPSLIPTAVDEVLRWVAPVMYFRRTATHPVELRGEKIREGDKVVMYYISANRDEDVFDDPDTFDVGRAPNEQISFGGGGPHYCLGANLAPLEIRIMFEELLKRLPDMELAGPIARLRSNFINGIKRMPVRYTAERARRDR